MHTLPPAIQAQWPTPTAATNRKSRRAMTASTENGRRSGGGQSSPPALEQMVELAEGIIPKELEGIDPANLPPATQAMWPTPRPSSASIYAESDKTLAARGRNGMDTLAVAVVKRTTSPTPTAADSSGRTGGHREGGDNWPTPMARDWKGADFARDENRSGLRHSGDDLPTAVGKREMWPTPLAGNPDAGSGGNHGGMALNQAARDSWPMPMAGHVQDGGGHEGVKLVEAATVEEAGTEAPRGQLNPDWVEWLMGWPIGWTSKEPLAPEAMSSWYEQTTQASWWLQEPVGIPRIAVDIPSRVSRLKAIGNGQVPLCAAWAALTLFETEQQVVEAIRAAADGPPTLDFLDL